MVFVGVSGCLGLQPSDICLILAVATSLYTTHPDCGMPMKEKRSPEVFRMYAPVGSVGPLPDQPHTAGPGGKTDPAWVVGYGVRDRPLSGKHGR